MIDLYGKMWALYVPYSRKSHCKLFKKILKHFSVSVSEHSTFRKKTQWHFISRWLHFSSKVLNFPFPVVIPLLYTKMNDVSQWNVKATVWYSYSLNPWVVIPINWRGGKTSLHMYTNIFQVTHTDIKEANSLEIRHRVIQWERVGDGCSFMSPHSGQGMGRLQGNKRAGKRERG